MTIFQESLKSTVRHGCNLFSVTVIFLSKLQAVAKQTLNG